jgi:hypothetical protein
MWSNGPLPTSPKLSDQWETGSSPGPRQQLLQPLLFHIKAGSSKNTENTFLRSSQPLWRNITTSCSTMTEQSINESPCDETYFLLTLLTLGICECSSPVDDVHQGIQVMHACDGTRGLVLPRWSAAATNTSALIVATPDMSMVIAPTNPKWVRSMGNDNRLPKYMPLLQVLKC